MGQSLVQNYLHLVFSTKNRLPMIDSRIEKELHRYLISISNELDCKVIQLGGYVDNIHSLCMLSKKITLVQFMEELKRKSSKWIKTKNDCYQNFYWQDGYGAFSVSPNAVNRVSAYIESQHQHHSTMSFQQEYVGMLEKYRVAFDEKYIWL
ncbi:MAG: IS200/IS605 family transposase [Chitinophagaceae bacterium]|nr:IS200/IS605 family transposase [Chitinophagaceae bacterium]